MPNVLDPTNNNMPDPPPIPRIGDVKTTPVGVPIPEASGVTPEQMLERAAGENELANATNEALSSFDPANPIPYKPANWSITGTELYPSFSFEETDIEAAEALNQKFQALSAVSSSNTSLLNTIGGTLNELQQNQSNFGNWVPETSPGDFELPDYTTRAWASRAQQQQNMVVAPGISNGLAGITRAYAQGLPLNSRAMNSSANDFYRTRLGVDFTGIESDREEVAPPSLIDRAVTATTRAGRRILLGPLSTLIEAIPGGEELANNLTPYGNPNESAAARRIIGAAASVAGERTRARIDQVGLPQFLSENTLGRLNPARSDSLGRLLLRTANPVRIFEEATGRETGIAPGILTPAPTTFRPAIGEVSTQQGLPAVIPNRPDLGDPGYFGQLAQTSPELRNLIRGLEPVINEAGIVGFNPAAGYFGDYGSAGSLSGLLWLAALPESIITGAMYDTVDLIRSLPYDERIDRLLGATRYLGSTAGLVGSLIGSQYAAGVNEQSLQRIDTLTGLLGRDTSFFQEYAPDRYLAVLGNPALDWLPRSGQVALGFALDMAVGGFSDAFIVEPLFNGLTRGRRAATSLVENLPPATPPTSLSLVPSSPRPSGPRPGTPPVAEAAAETGVPAPIPNVIQPSTNIPIEVPELTVLPAVPSFSSKTQADAVVVRLQRTLADDEQRLRELRTATEADPALVARLESRVAANRARVRIIEDIDWTSDPRIFDEVAVPVGSAAPKDAETLVELLTSPAAQAGDLTGAYQVTRNIDINARGGVDVTPDVVNFRREGTAVSDIPVARVAPEVVTELPVSKPKVVRDVPSNQELTSSLERVRAQIDDMRKQVARSRPFRSWSVDDSGDAVRVTSYPANSNEEIFTNLQTSLDNLLAEEKSLSQLLEASEVADYAEDVIRMSSASIDDNGIITESGADVLLDELMPAVKLEDVSPATAASLPEAIAMTPVTGVDISGKEAVVVRRTDDELNQLAQLWGINTNNNLPTNPEAQLANMFRQSVLEREFPNLLSRYGSAVPSELLDSNLARIVVQKSNALRPQQSLPSSVNRKAPVDYQPAVSSDLKEARKRLARLSKAAKRSVDKLTLLRAVEDLDFEAAQRELSRLNSIRSNIELVYASYPELAVRNILDSLPDYLRPTGPSASTIGSQYAFELHTFHKENQLLNKIGHELAITDVLLRQQQQRILALPPVQRINPGNEFATVRQYDPEFNMHGVDEHDIPESDIIADLSPDLVQDMTSKELVSFIMQVSKATREQAEQAIFNGLRAGQLTRKDGLYSHTGETLQDIFRRADLIQESADDGTVSLLAYKAAKEMTEDLKAAQREAVEGIIDLKFRRRLKNNEVDEAVIPTAQQLTQAGQELSDTVQDLSSTNQELNELADEALKWIEDYKIVSGTTPDGTRVFGVETPSGEIIAGAGGEQRIEPLQVTRQLDALSIQNVANELEGWTGTSNKVWISDLEEALRVKGYDVSNLKETLLELNRTRQLDLARADLAYAADQNKVAASLITKDTSSFHFIVKTKDEDSLESLFKRADEIVPDKTPEDKLEDTLNQLNLPDEEKQAWRQSWEEEDYKADVVWLGEGTDAQQEYMRRTGSPYLAPTIASEEELMATFPDPKAVYSQAVELGFEGDSMFEVLARYSQNPNDPEAANLWPVARERVFFADSLLRQNDELYQAYLDTPQGGDLNGWTKGGDELSLSSSETGYSVSVVPDDVSGKWRFYPEDEQEITEFDTLDEALEYGENWLNDFDELEAENVLDEIAKLEGVTPNYLGPGEHARIMYHGTHAASLIPGMKASSPSNELGMGLYITNNIDEATLHARAQVAQDVVVLGTVRPRFTDEGRVFEVISPPRDEFPDPISGVNNPSFNDSTLTLPRASTLGWNVVDAATTVAGNANEKTVGTMLAYAVKEVMGNANRANPIPSEIRTPILRRFNQWSKRHPYREWHQYLRNQIEKEMGEGAQRYVVSFQQDLQAALERRNVDAIKDGNTYNIVNSLGFFVDKVHPDSEGAVDIAGQLAARVEIEKLAYSRNPSVTNMAKLEQAYLDYNTYRRNQLADAVAQQEIIATEATAGLGKTERTLQQLVAEDAAKLRERQLEQMQKKADDMADEIEAIDGDCP